MTSSDSELTLSTGRHGCCTLICRQQGTTLWREQVVLHSKTGNHGTALRLLAIQICDVKAALQ